MNTTTLAIAVLMSACGACCDAHIEVFDLLPGYTIGDSVGLSADGSTLTIDMFVQQSIQFDAYSWRDGAWSSLPRLDQFNQWQGISADGQITLSVSSQWGSRPQLVRVENGERDYVTYGADRPLRAGLRRDGQAVLFAMGDQTTGPIDLFHYEANSFDPIHLLTLGDQYSYATDVLVGERDDQFVINSYLHPAGIGNPSTSRALLYDDGTVFEIPTLSGKDHIHSRAVTITGDGSTTVGVESNTTTGLEQSWMYRNGVLTEITLEGYNHFAISSITDDAKA